MRLNVVASFLISLAFADKIIARPGRLLVLDAESDPFRAYHDLFPVRRSIPPGLNPNTPHRRITPIQTDNPSQLTDDRHWEAFPDGSNVPPFSFALLHDDVQFWLHFRGDRDGGATLRIYSREKRVHSEEIFLEKGVTKKFPIPRGDVHGEQVIFHM
jgi:hypothetical protein